MASRQGREGGAAPRSGASLKGKGKLPACGQGELKEIVAGQLNKVAAAAGKGLAKWLVGLILRP